MAKYFWLRPLMTD